MTTFALVPGAGGSAHRSSANAMVPVPGEKARDWWANTGAHAAQEAAALVGGYGPFDEATYFMHDLDPALVIEGQQHRPVEADIAFESPCVFPSWPADVRVLAGRDDRFFPVDLQRRVARERLGVEVDVIPGGHLLPLVQPALVAAYLLRR